MTGHVARVRPGQAGYSVADEAEEIKAAAIVVGLRYRNGVPLYDKTLQTVLGERPCRVIVVSDPTDKPTAVPGAAPGRGDAVNGERVYRGAVRAFSLVFVALGAAAPRRHPRQRRRPGLDRLPARDRLPRVGVGRLWIGARMGR